MLEGDLSFIPEIEILSGDELGTANSGYAASNNKIYLSARFVATATPTAINNAILEEIGHSIDTLINRRDAAEKLFIRLIENVLDSINPLKLDFGESRSHGASCSCRYNAAFALR